MKNLLPELSQIRVNFHPEMKDENIRKSCQISNFTCGPMVEITVEQISVENTNTKPIIEIKFNKIEYRIHNLEHEWQCVYWNEEGRYYTNMNIILERFITTQFFEYTKTFTGNGFSIL